ncbi:hypothetical protein UR09_04735 [Candidatus Nitromaritima sp. SCGC AAA799-A02]|nr:hypothetical protein UR09_04735 [Candidatus Nitromaritima sp. SCGC AAA799-A02]KMP12455.1 hypothetical protein UZ36_00940 [Candidatus Nitromaritima sp. SCGC AAA799-C22]
MERRDHLRISANQPVSVTFEGNPVSVELYDMSVGGIALVSETEFSEGSRLKVQLPVSSSSRAELVDVEVLRSASRPDASNQYIIAAIFIDPSPQWLDAAMNFMRA